jgi:hypothetical protein
MGEFEERRTEKRLRYHWPVWFAEDFDDVLSQGRMVDVSSRGASFACPTDGSCPHVGQRLTVRFSVPKFDENSFEMEDFMRSGHVCRIQEQSAFAKRAAMQFAEPLPFSPGEQSWSESFLEGSLQPA